jgi:hypothetical protein
VVSRTHPTPHHKYRSPIRSRSRGGGERLFDTASRDGSSKPSPVGKLWLLPVMIAVGVAVAYFGMTGGPTRSSLCETLRAFNIDGPKSCRNVVWVRAKSREWTKPISRIQPNPLQTPPAPAD